MFTVQGVNSDGVTFISVEVEDFAAAAKAVEQLRQNPRCVSIDVDQRVFSEVRSLHGDWRAVRK